MHREQLELLKQIMALEFYNVELVLFLDTHPADRQALNEYYTITEKLENLKRRYEEQYGMLTTYCTASSEYPWQWVEQPWPWEINY